MNLKFEPVLVRGFIVALFAALLGCGLTWFTADRAGLIAAAVGAALALIQAVTTRPKVVPIAKLAATVEEPAQPYGSDDVMTVGGSNDDDTRADLALEAFVMWPFEPVRSVTFKPGRLKPYADDDPAHPKLKLTLPEGATPLVNADWLSKVPSWPMYGNDRMRDCTIAAAAHMIQAWTAYSGTEVTITEADVLKAYIALTGYDPKTGANDTGCVMQDVLNYWRKEGIGGHKILAFAKIDHTNPAQTDAGIAAFGGVYDGVNVPQSAEDQFNAGQPWTVVKGSPNLGGHCIHQGRDDEAVTWGAVEKVTAPWWATYLEEQWIIITQDWIDTHGQTPAGQAVAALGEQFTALTGQPSPFAPSPTPTPSAPVMTPELAARLSAFVETGHVTGLKTAAKAAGIS